MSLDFASTYRMPRQDHGTAATRRIMSDDDQYRATYSPAGPPLKARSHLDASIEDLGLRPHPGVPSATLTGLANALLGERDDALKVTPANPDQPLDADTPRTSCSPGYHVVINPSTFGDDELDEDLANHESYADRVFELDDQHIGFLPLKDDLRGRALDRARRYDDADYAENSRYGGDNPWDGFHVTDRP